MKKTAVAILALVLLGAATLPADAADRRDFKVIQAAVKKSPNPEYVEGREAKWFKVLITEGRAGEAKIRLTLPVALIELVMGCDAARRVRFDRGRRGPCEVDLKALWAELKKAGPMALVELEDDGTVIKVWLE